MSAPSRLRELLKRPPVLAASCFDPLSARLAELAGFKAIHLTGMGVEATQIGAPDIGLMTAAELASHAARITEAVDIPILADIDTGFGGLVNIHRTIRQMERAGIAGVHIEDQTLPKRCPAIDGRTVVSRDEAIDRIKTACAARTDSDFIIVARSDADVVSFDELVERCNLYIEAGADMAMPMTTQLSKKLTPNEQMELLTRLASQIKGPVMTSGAHPPRGYTANDLGQAGYSFIMFATTAVMASANAIYEVFAETLRTGANPSLEGRNPGKFQGLPQLFDALRLEKYVGIEQAKR
jgi:2-methylisocitrate lyase-like PEP mutase family enzyme